MLTSTYTLISVGFRALLRSHQHRSFFPWGCGHAGSLLWNHYLRGVRTDGDVEWDSLVGRNAYRIRRYLSPDRLSGDFLREDCDQTLQKVSSIDGPCSHHCSGHRHPRSRPFILSPGKQSPGIPLTSSPDDLWRRSLSVAIGSYTHLSNQRSVNCRHVCLN